MRNKTIDERFEEFHRENPHVYRELVYLARYWKSRGFKKLGIGMLFEVLRWRRAFQTGESEYKLPNDFRSRYARLIMQQEPDLEGIFETRSLRSKGMEDEHEETSSVQAYLGI